jgi:hypothetical protein
VTTEGQELVVRALGEPVEHSGDVVRQLHALLEELLHVEWLAVPLRVRLADVFSRERD